MVGNVEGLRHAVACYLMRCGYLTKGFCGDGPMKMKFVKDFKSKNPAVVGIKNVENSRLWKVEVVAVEVKEDKTHKTDYIRQIINHSAFANKLYLAMATEFVEEDKNSAKQTGVGLLEVHGNYVKEVVAPEARHVQVPAFPTNRFGALKLAAKLLQIKQDDWNHLARVFLRAKEAFLGICSADMFVNLSKDEGRLRLEMAAHDGPLRRSGEYSFRLGELAGFAMSLRDDRFGCIKSAGDLLLLRQSDWRCFLRLLSRVFYGHAAFEMGSISIKFEKLMGDDEITMFFDSIDGHNSKYIKHSFSPDEIAKMARAL